ncbi:uncharacterized protein ACA1_039640 [Acanthamoeba castellanii str. Neff]|uniref:ParB/Sulfiredoxin domain-containing protein n=1 Tax=Acanthamoeba castellanii (strain ATCC 30010 / Neff) TaxID=1257118 RepID=L8H7N1_ACACF|nr:uncharacterized protein ACA1_039640 [Acanthamoeba castellanii str. Neff]ELR20486.1 hypothetical protein ACA1_039640 [Acanthamoeba castellanii str. Neff]
MRRRPPSPSYLAESGTWTLPLADPWGVTQQVDQPQPTYDCIEETASIHLHGGPTSDFEDCATSATGALETGGPPEASPQLPRKKKKKKEKEHNSKKKSERKKRDEAPSPLLPLDDGVISSTTTTTSSSTTTSSTTATTATVTGDAGHQGLRRQSPEMPAPTPAKKKNNNKEHKQQQRALKHGRHRDHRLRQVVDDTVAVDNNCNGEDSTGALEYAGADCFGGGGGGGGADDEAGAVGRRRVRRRGGSLEMLPSERRSRELRMSGIDEAMLRSILADIDVHASAAVGATSEAGDVISAHSEPETMVEAAASAAVDSSDHCDAAVAAAHKTATARQKRKQKLSSKSDDDMNRTYVGMFPQPGGGKPAGGGAAKKRSSNKPQPQPQPSEISPAFSPPPTSTTSTATQQSGGFMRKLRNDALSRSLDLIPHIFAQKPTAAAATTAECVEMLTTEGDDPAASSTPSVVVVVDKRANKKRAGSLGRSATERAKDDISDDVAAAAATPPAAAVGPIKNEQQRKKDRKRAKKSQAEDELRATLEPKALAGASPRSEATSGLSDAAEPTVATAAAANAADDQGAEDPQPQPPLEPSAYKLPLSVASPKPARPKSAIEKAKKTVGDGADKSAGSIKRRSSYDRSSIAAAAVEGSVPAPPVVNPAPTTEVRSPPTSPSAAKEKRRRSGSAKDGSAGGAAAGPLKQLKTSDAAAAAASTAAVARKMSTSTLTTTTPTAADMSHSLASSASMSTTRPSPESLRLPLAKLEALRTDGGSSVDPGGAQARLTTTKRAMGASPASPTDDRGGGGGSADVSDDDQPSLEDSYGVYLMKRMKHRKKRKKRKKQAKGLRAGAGNEVEAEAEGDDEGDEVFFAHLKSGFENYRNVTADPLLPSSPPPPSLLNADAGADADTAAPESPVKKKKKKKKLRVKIEVAAGEEEGEGDEGERGRAHDRQSNHGNDDDVGDADADAVEGNAATAASVADEKGERSTSRRTSRQFSDSPSARSRMLGAPRRSLSDTNLRATYLADERRQESLKEKRRKLRRSRSINLLELYKAKHTTRKERPVVPITELRPTQFTVGMLAVSHQTKKINKMAKTCGEAKLIKYIGKKTVPVVVGPEQRFYMLDRHHAARALWDSEVDAALKVLHVQILADLSGLSEDEFWDKMKRNKCTYLTKHGQDPLSPDLLPPNVGELSDDAYRSLAWAVKSRKGFKATSIPFAEFIWADFLREQLRKELGGEEDIYAVVGEAIDTCHSACAAHLPGNNQHDHSHRHHLAQLLPFPISVRHP